MKKHSKTGVDSRYQGTILGKPADPKAIKIEGGPVDSIEEWCRKTRDRAANAKAVEPARESQEDHDSTDHMDDAIGSQDDSEDAVMDL